VSHVEEYEPGRGDGGAAEALGGHARAAGGFMGAIAAEGRLGSRRPLPSGPRPVSEAMIELAQAFVARHGQGTPLDVAARFRGVGSPAWLLPVAIVRPRSDTLNSDALRLAHAAGVPGHALPHCVGYVELGAALLGGQDDVDAVEAVSGQPARGHLPTALTLCGDPHLDALTTGMWALQQRGSFAEVLGTLASLAPPGAAAAAGALLGLRHGLGAVPVEWHDHLPAAGCVSLAGELVSVRHKAFLAPPSRSRPRSAGASAPGRIAAATSDAGAAWGWSGPR
jgi:hypothetical protein